MRSRRGNEAEVLFALKSASSRRRLSVLNSPWLRTGLFTPLVEGSSRCKLAPFMEPNGWGVGHEDWFSRGRLLGLGW